MEWLEDWKFLGHFLEIFRTFKSFFSISSYNLSTFSSPKCCWVFDLWEPVQHFARLRFRCPAPASRSRSLPNDHSWQTEQMSLVRIPKETVLISRWHNLFLDTLILKLSFENVPSIFCFHLSFSLATWRGSWSPKSSIKYTVGIWITYLSGIRSWKFVRLSDCLRLAVVAKRSNLRHYVICNVCNDDWKVEGVQKDALLRRVNI